MADPGNARPHAVGRRAVRVADQVRGRSNGCRSDADPRQPAPADHAGERRRRDRGRARAPCRGAGRDGSRAGRRGPGGAPRRFTAGPRRDFEPRWSPDGARLAFLSERAPKDKLQLYVMPADGGEPTKLTALEHGVSSLAWSPDGSRLAFVSAVGGQREPDSEEEKRKSRPARVITSAKYRLNGEGFVYDRRPHVFVVSTDDSTPVQITDGD